MTCCRTDNEPSHVRWSAMHAIAVSLAIYVFALTIANSVWGTRHNHSDAIDRGEMHVSFTCMWMCATSSFIAQGDQINSFYWIPYLTVFAISGSYYIQFFLSNIFLRGPPIFTIT